MRWFVEMAVIGVLVVAAGAIYNSATERGLDFVPSEIEAKAIDGNRSCDRQDTEDPEAEPAPAPDMATSPTTPASGGSGVEGASGDPASAGGAGKTTVARIGKTVPDANAAATGGAASSPAAKSGIPHIGLEDAIAAWEDGLVFVDARASKYYVEGHIPGARSIAAWESGKEAKIQAIIDGYGTATPIVIYCNESEECEDSHIVGDILKGFGCEALQVYEGGFPGWIKGRQPYVKGSEPGSIDTAIQPDDEAYGKN